MGDQDQQNGEGQSDQQNQTDGQSQSNAQRPPVAKQASPAAMAAAGLATDGTQSQGDGQSGAADSQSDTGQSSTAQQTHSASSGQAHSAGSGQAQTPLQAGQLLLDKPGGGRRRLKPVPQKVGARGHAPLQAAAPHGDQLGDDADGDLFDRLGADVHADGRVDASQVTIAEATLSQSPEDSGHLALAPYHADVARGSREGVRDNILVQRVAAGDGDDVACVINRNCAEGLLYGGDHQFVRAGKPLPVGELSAVVNHHDS